MAHEVRHFPEGGRFPEGGLVDRLDKTLSRLFFHLTLPAPLEFALSFPGACFGNPLYCLGVAPVLLASAAKNAQTGDTTARILGSSVLAVSAGVWWRQAWVGSQAKELKDDEGLGALSEAFGITGVLVCPHVTMGVIKLAGCAEGPAALYLTTWLVTQTVVEAIKQFFSRRRPAYVLKEELEEVPRAIKELSEAVKTESQRCLAFPSGDAAGAGAFCATLALAMPGVLSNPDVLLEPKVLAPLLTVTLLSPLGRMYWHAHHLLDVTVGYSCGLGVTLALHKFLKPGWIHVPLAQLCTVLLWDRLKGLKPKALPAERR